MNKKRTCMLLILASVTKKPLQAFTSHRYFESSTHIAMALPQIDEKSLLFQWTAHDDASFHHFDKDEAALIRQSLLTWYRINRRKLPWRGDPPPYDGSTAGTNDVKKSRKKESQNQTSIESFFTSKSKIEENKSMVSNWKDDAITSPVSAYGVWVSEIMLQQTRVEAVIPYYVKWMNAFPTVQALANASEEDVNAHWAGLGFYRRARLLHKGAALVVEKYGGELPKTVDELMGIHGIGQYTASAIASIAFGVCVPVVDGNVCRVLTRLRGIANNIKAPILKDKLGWGLAEQIVKAGSGEHAGEVNQALMELGATYCAPSGTGIDDRDPLKSFYMSTKLAASFDSERKNLAEGGYNTFPVETFFDITIRHDDKVCALCGDNKASVLTEFSDSWNQGLFAYSHGPFPLAPPKASKREEVLVVAVLTDTRRGVADKWLLVKRPKEGLLAGQWEFPSVCVWSSADEEHPKSKKRKDVDVPFIAENVRSKALTGLLGSLAATSRGKAAILKGGKRTRLQESVEHIFSHVRHTMWIEHGTLDDMSNETSWMSINGKEVRWMSKDDMEKVGVTSGVKKILKTVATKSMKRTKC